MKNYSVIDNCLCVQGIGTKRSSLQDFFRKKTKTNQNTPKPETHQNQHTEILCQLIPILLFALLMRFLKIRLLICAFILTAPIQFIVRHQKRSLFLVLRWHFSTGPNKSKLHSFLFEIVPLSSVKSQNISLTDFVHSLGAWKPTVFRAGPDSHSFVFTKG